MRHAHESSIQCAHTLERDSALKPVMYYIHTCAVHQRALLAAAALVYPCLQCAAVTVQKASGTCPPAFCRTVPLRTVPLL
jgi:hypothetical protein